MDVYEMVKAAWQLNAVHGCMRRAEVRSVCPLHCPSRNPPVIINQLLVYSMKGKYMLSIYPALINLTFRP